MELWIRSQNKTILSKAHDLVIREDRNENSETNYFIVDTYTLGIYKTKERALEVLDEIQSILKLKDMYKYDRELVLKSWENMDAEQVKTVRQQMSVYEMPEE
jgi:hypothetical protein